jgi:hypothetical protein
VKRFTLGTHNLFDERGTVTLFADLIVFTEAIPARVRAAVRGTPHRAVVCVRQPDLVVVYDNRVFKRDWLRPTRYRKYVDGWAKVTPNRGTFTVPLVHRATGRKVRVNAEHRINAAFPPYRRGEGPFRETAWRKHTGGTLGLMDDQNERGHLVITAGDVNTPRGVAGYPGYYELGHGYDRMGSNERLTGFESLTTMGSDHRRLRATVVLASRTV